jgi:hypothetical protein
MNIRPHFVIFHSFLSFNTVFDILHSPLGSEAMSLVQLFVPAEVAHDTVAELGELGNVEFRDVCPLYMSPFSLTQTLDSAA